MYIHKNDMSSNSINYSVYIAQKAKRAFSGKLKKIFKDTKFGHEFWGKIGKNTPKKWFLQYYDFSRDPGMSIPGNGNSRNHFFPGNPGTRKHYPCTMHNLIFPKGHKSRQN